jgi:predicted site-specific integrase-resolvase
MVDLHSLEEDPYMTPLQISKLFGVKPYTIRQWIKSGKFDQSKISKFDNRIKIRRSAVQELAQKMFGDDSDSESSQP